MYTRPLIILLAVLTIVAFTSSGCKGKVEKTQTSLGPEGQEALMPEVVVEAPPAEVPQLAPAQVTPPQPQAVSPMAAQPQAMPQERVSREKEIQQALKNAGYYIGEIDGIVGPQTKKATRDFQAAKDLEVDGKVGPKTWTELKNYLTQ